MSVPEECPDDGAEQPSKAGDRQTRDHGDRISNSGSVADGFQRAEVDPGPHPGHRGLLAEHPARLYLRNGDVVVRPMMYLAVSYDHRVIDGATAVQFLVRIKQLIEDPETLLIEG